MGDDNFVYLVLMFAGIFTTLGAIFNWGIFLSGKRANIIIRIFGRTIARLVYFLVGIFLTGLGAVLAFDLYSFSF